MIDNPGTPPKDAMANHGHDEHEAMERAFKESPLALRVRELLVGMDPAKRPDKTSPRCHPPSKAQ